MIEPIKLDNPKYVVQKEKGVRYTLLKRSYFDKQTKRFRRMPKYIFLYDFGTNLNVFKFQASQDKQPFKVKNLERYIFKVKNGKLRIYFAASDRFRNHSHSPQSFYFWASTLFTVHDGEKSKKSDIGKNVFEWRFNKILKNFLKRNGIKFKFNKNPYINCLKASYPCFRGLDLQWCPNLNGSITKYLGRNETFKDVLEDIFGNSGKQISKEIYPLFESETVNQALVEKLQFGAATRGLVSFDFILGCLKTHVHKKIHFNSQISKSIMAFRRVLRHYNVDRRKLLLKSLLECDVFYAMLVDTVYYFVSPERLQGFTLPERPRSFSQIHDELHTHLNQQWGRGYTKEEDFELGIIKDKKYEKIDGYKIDNLQIVVPKTSFELKEWGAIMHNCIGGYGSRVTGGHSRLLGVLKDGQLTYNIEINNSEVYQFFAARNQRSDEVDKGKVLGVLEEFKIIKSRLDKIRESMVFIEEPLRDNDLALAF